jgi:hypothetical protein
MQRHTDWVRKLKKYSKNALIQVQTDKGEWVKATRDQALAWIRYENNAIDRDEDRYTVSVKSYETQGNPRDWEIRKRGGKSVREIRVLTPGFGI